MTIKTALLLGYECNNNCIFCYCGGKRLKYSPESTQWAKKQLLAARERGSTFIDFLGGEPTIRKDIFELVEFAKLIGFEKISVTTNGRMFYYKEFCQKMLGAGLNSAVFSIHGHTPELHDSLTRSPGSFLQATAGMKNLKKLAKDFYICTNTTIVKQNYQFLPEIAESNARFGADGMEFIFVHPRGNALANFDEVVPTLTEIVPYIQKTIEVGLKNGIEHTQMRYMPMCCMVGYEDHLSEYSDRKKQHHIGPEFEDLNVEENRRELGRLKGPQCNDCKLFDKCEGIFVEYAERRGFGELRPVLN